MDCSQAVFRQFDTDSHEISGKLDGMLQKKREILVAIHEVKSKAVCLDLLPVTLKVSILIRINSVVPPVHENMTDLVSKGELSLHIRQSVVDDDDVPPGHILPEPTNAFQRGADDDIAQFRCDAERVTGLELTHQRFRNALMIHALSLSVLVWGVGFLIL